MRDADLVLRNGNLLTFDRSSRIASSVAIANGRICMVGSDDEIARNVPPDARTIDLRGRSAMPGFFDGHPHMDREGLKLARALRSQGCAPSMRSSPSWTVPPGRRRPVNGLCSRHSVTRRCDISTIRSSSKTADSPTRPRSRCGCTEQPCVHSQRVGLVEHASVPLRGKYGGAPVDGGHQQ